ncbi:MAG: S-layer homology domain-containing protein, partial [Mycobacteriales bacterium]
LPDTQGQQKKWLLHIGRSFSDVPPTSLYYRHVETLTHHGITGGCLFSRRGNFCPSTPTSREQMAPLLLIAKEGSGYPTPACGGDVFDDVTASNPFCGWIEELARRGVVRGCAPGLYCPQATVAREQIAVFVLRTLVPGIVPPPCAAPNVYADVPESHPYCAWIEELANRGVVSDCGGGNYCPAAEVSREQMAFFVTSGFGLTLYGP